MLAIEYLRGLITESGHLQFVDSEAIDINGIDDLAHVSVSIGLDHGECALAVNLETLSGGDIRVVSDLKLATKHSYNGTNEEVIKRGDASEWASLKEYSLILLIILYRNVRFSLF